ncbi:MAG: NYN domain-containing protein [Bacteroidetes bacterium]|nr:NYN domain-containing protein [Bacteroidota bacterium]
MPHLSLLKNSVDDGGYAAIFVDFENVFYYLRNAYADLPDLTEYTLELLRNLRNYLEQELHLQPIVRFAYADFERLASAPLGSLYLMGIEIRNVLGAQHKNAADMRLCIDAMQTLYTRPDIRTFVFVAGDRDYIPVIQHIQTQARTVKAVAFRGNLSGDLLQNIGEENFIDAHTLLDEESLKRLESEAAYARERERIIEEERQKKREEQERGSGSAAEQASAGASDTDTREGKTVIPLASKEAGRMDGNPQMTDERISAPKAFAKPVPLMTDDQRFCMEFMLREYGLFPEIYIGPFLHRLTDVMPHLADYERKSILHDLEQLGAIRVESRRGEPHDYRVIIVNYNHPNVRELNPG